MSLPLSVFGIALAAAGLCVLFQKSSPAFAFLLSLGAAVILMFRVGAAAAELLAGLHRLGGDTRGTGGFFETGLAGQAGGTAFSCLLRCTGLTLLTDYTRSLCEEAGAESLGWCVGLAGRCLILAAAWPLLEEIGQRIWSIAG